MADRRRDTLLLISGRDDLRWLPSPRPVGSGFVPATFRPCGSCGHLSEPGWVVDRFGRRSPCVACGGATEPSGGQGQWVRKDAGRGRVAFDRMDSLEAAVGSSSTFATARPRATVVCDSCGGGGAHGNGRRCVVCGGAGRRDLYAFDLRLDAVGDDGGDEAGRIVGALIRRERAGSFLELDRALDALRRADRGLHRRLLQAVDAGSPLAGSLDEALSFVVARMPDPVRVPGELRTNLRLRRERRTRAKGRGGPVHVRDAEIRRLVRSRKPVQWVAGEYGLAVSTVYEIVRKGPTA